MQEIDPLRVLVNELSKLPGIGEKSASRLAFFIMKSDEDYAKKLASSIFEARTQVSMCDICNNFTSGTPCSICSSGKRDNNTICVVEDPSDLWAIERTGTYRGRYHVLHGLISPLSGIGPDDLKLKSLVKRLEGSTGEVEVMLATNPTVEGEATSMYIKKLLAMPGVRVTRVAYGLPVGSDIEYVDKITLSKAIEFRRDYG